MLLLNWTLESLGNPFEVKWGDDAALREKVLIELFLLCLKYMFLVNHNNLLPTSKLNPDNG